MCIRDRANAGAFELVLAVQALKNAEQLACVLHVNTGTVVLDPV